MPVSTNPIVRRCNSSNPGNKVNPRRAREERLVRRAPRAFPEALPAAGLDCAGSVVRMFCIWAICSPSLERRALASSRLSLSACIWLVMVSNLAFVDARFCCIDPRKSVTIAFMAIDVVVGLLH